MEKLSKITRPQIAEKGVQALADRPNANAQYGVGGLSPQQLKLHFDKLATFLAEKINEIIGTISADEAANYIRIALDDYGVGSLQDLIDAMLSGDFASKILQVFPSVNSFDTVPLQQYINDAAQAINENAEYINSLSENKLDKVSSPAGYRRAYIIDTDGTQKEIYISESALAGALPVYTAGGSIKTSSPVKDDEAANKGYVESAILETLGDIANVRKLPVYKGNAEPSLIIFEGEGKGLYSIVGGTDNKDALGDLGAIAAVADEDLELPSAEKPLAISFGIGSKTLSTGGLALGVNVTSGVKGYYWWSVSGTTFELSTTRKTLITVRTLPESLDWEVGDYICVVNTNKYPFIATITAVDKTNMSVTVDALPNVKVNGSNVAFCDTYSYQAYLGMNPDDMTIFAIKRGTNSLTNHIGFTARSGDIELAWGAAVVGALSIGAGTFSYNAGYSNCVYDFGAVFGRENMCGYASLVGGAKNIDRGLYNLMGGHDNTLGPGVSNATIGGQHNTILAGNGASFGYNNLHQLGSASALSVGDGLIANSWCQALFGRYNDNTVSKNDLLVVGNGSKASARSNAFRVHSNGSATVSKDFNIGGDLFINGVDIITHVLNSVPAWEGGEF